MDYHACDTEHIKFVLREQLSVTKYRGRHACQSNEQTRKRSTATPGRKKKRHRLVHSSLCIAIGSGSSESITLNRSRLASLGLLHQLLCMMLHDQFSTDVLPLVGKLLLLLLTERPGCPDSVPTQRTDNAVIIMNEWKICMHTYRYIYIYMYAERERERNE